MRSAATARPMLISGARVALAAVPGTCLQSGPPDLPFPSGIMAGPGGSDQAVCGVVPRWARGLLGPLVAEPVPRDLDCVEAYAGVAAIARAFTAAGLASRAYDKVISEEDDVLTVTGLVRLFWLVLRLKPGGLLWAAPPCSMWSFMSSSVHCRTKKNPRGDRTRYSVREANNVARITACVIKIATFRGVRFCMENPGRRIGAYPPMARALAYARAGITTVYLGAFGGPLPKPVTVWSNARFVARLQRPKPPTPDQEQTELYYTQVAWRSAACVRWVPRLLVGYGLFSAELDARAACEAGAVNGKPALAETGAYPDAFGEAVLQCFLASRGKILEELRRGWQPGEAAESDSEQSVVDLHVA